MARPHCDIPLVFFGASSIRQRQIADAIGTKTNGLKQKEMVGYMNGWQMRWQQFLGPFYLHYKFWLKFPPIMLLPTPQLNDSSSLDIHTFIHSFIHGAKPSKRHHINNETMQQGAKESEILGFAFGLWIRQRLGVRYLGFMPWIHQRLAFAREGDVIWVCLWIHQKLALA